MNISRKHRDVSSDCAFASLRWGSLVRRKDWLPDYQWRRLVQIAKRVEESSGIKISIKGVQNDTPNAYTNGHMVWVTTGLLNTLDDNELLWVIAHEANHIKHNDVKEIYDVYNGIARLMMDTAKSRKKFLTKAGLLFIEGTVGTLLALRGERNREYFADEFGAKILEYYDDNVEVAVNALRKLEPYTVQNYEFLLDHPSVENRIYNLYDPGSWDISHRLAGFFKRNKVDVNEHKNSPQSQSQQDFPANWEILYLEGKWP